MSAVNTTSYLSRLAGIPNQSPKPDLTSNFGLAGLVENLRQLTNLDINAIAIGSSTTPTLTAAQFASGIWDISGSPGSGVTLTTPTAAQIIGALPSTIPKDGTFNYPIFCLNDATTQTLTVTGGSNVTVLGTATVANNTDRIYICNVNVNAGTVTMMNLGSLSL